MPAAPQEKKNLTKKKIILVVGARPNFMKVAPVLRAIREQASPHKASAPGRGRADIVHIDCDYAVSEISGGIARERDAFDFAAMPS